MKKKFVAGQLLKFRFSIIIVLVLFLVSCEPENSTLGVNLFPPSDTILVYTDTVYNLETQLVRSKPVFSSVYTSVPNPDKTFLLGANNDTITGISSADIVAQLAFSYLGNFGAEPLLDSLHLWLYVSEVIGDTAEEMRILVHEFTGEISYSESYYSDYDITDQYDPIPLVDEMIVPKPDTYYEFSISNQDYLTRIGQAIKDSVFASVDSLKQAFPGLYITTEVQPDSRTFARVGLANNISRLGFQYVHDSVSSDTVTAEDYDWYYLNFNEFYSQKINMFHHDYTGTTLEALESAVNPTILNPSVLYAQGMAGVNAEITLPDLGSLIDSGMVAINSARLVFEVLKDTMSGISVDDYPQNLMLSNISSDTSRQVIYDLLVNTSTNNFGRLIRSNDVSAFLDPLYLYKFNLGLHLQSILTGDLENSNLILYVMDPATTSKYIKLWSNDPDQKGSLRLEIVYTKF